MYTVEAGKQVKILASVNKHISYTRPLPKNQNVYHFKTEQNKCGISSLKG
jgi:hypothetical protein